jgi:hypothetical protein
MKARTHEVGPSSPGVLLACRTEPPHLGEHLVRAADRLGVPTVVADTNDALRGPEVLGKIAYRLDRRSPSMSFYQRRLLARAKRGGARILLSTGMAPIEVDALRALGELGLLRVNFSTDDPWNPVNGSSWFFRALREYDLVFTPRRANLDDLRSLAGPRVEYLPFAYEPRLHHPADDVELRAGTPCDVAFVGGADADRLPYLDALRAAGLSLRVYGGAWDRHPRYREIWGGHVDGSGYRAAVAAAKVNLCLVRRANRDGHVMRTFELPAMLTCILAEDTSEHRAIYGSPEEATVAYFDTIESMVAQAKRLAADEALRSEMARRVLLRITEAPNTYQDRFAAMIARATELLGARL